jgi:SAM-dependent methyltransferase
MNRVLPAEYDAMHLVEMRHWWFRGRRRVLMDLLKDVAGSRSGSIRILDYGCGTGGNTPSYASLGSVVGIEPDGAAIRLAGRRAGARYARASGTQLPFRAGVFDTVVASDVLEHIDDDLAAVSEIARVLTPGGAVVFSVPAHPWLFSEHDAALHHFRRYTKAGLRGVLERGGLKIRRLTYWNTALFPAVALHRLLGRRRPGGIPPRSDTRPTFRPVNEALAGLLRLEAAILHHASLPWGVSLVGVAARL